LLDVEARRAAAATLWRLAADDAQVSALPADQRPADLADGWAIQRELDALAGPRIGWKVASTSRDSQQRLGMTEPLAGAMYERQLVANMGTVPATRIGIVEGEFAFVMSADVVQGRSPLTVVYAGVEVPDSRLAGYPDISPPLMVADFMLARYYVLGDRLDIAPADLRDAEIVVRRNGEEAGRGIGADVLGDPCNVLVWLAGELAGRGDYIRAGDLITTGGCAVVRGVAAGDTVIASFAGRTKVGVSFAAGSAAPR
jgi:2-keto-4-pentenoate hydratase